jgi:hypothetical protein
VARGVIELSVQLLVFLSVRRGCPPVADAEPRHAHRSSDSDFIDVSCVCKRALDRLLAVWAETVLPEHAEHPRSTSCFIDGATGTHLAPGVDRAFFLLQIPPRFFSLSSSRRRRQDGKQVRRHQGVWPLHACVPLSPGLPLAFVLELILVTSFSHSVRLYICRLRRFPLWL